MNTEAGASTLPLAEPDPRRWTVLAILCLCLVLVVAGVSSLNVAIPSIVRALDASQTQQLWILDAYAVVFAGLLLPAGAIGDRYGRKGALLTGLGIFAGAAIVASYADDPGWVIVMRATMGIGAALIMPATLSIITVVFPPHERGRAIAIWAGLAGAGGAIGMLASGLLLERFWWGSVFFVNVPLTVLAFVAILALVPSSRDEDRLPLDPVGALLSMAGLTALVFAIIMGPEEGWADGVTLGAFAVAAVCLLAFVRYELGTATPMLDPRFFRARRFTLGSLTITANFLAMFGMFFLMTMYLQFVHEHTALGAAVRLLPFPVTMMLVTPRSPKIVARYGARAVVTAGLLIQAGGFAVAATLQPGSHYVHLASALVLMATGMALLMPPSTMAIVSSVPQNKAGVGSAVNDTTREVGGAIGIALLGSLMSMRYRSGVSDLASTDGVPAVAGERISDSVAGAHDVASRLLADDAASPLAEQVVDVANNAFTSGSLLAFTVASGVSVLTAVVVNRYYPSDQPPAERSVADQVADEGQDVGEDERQDVEMA